jgi:hypothetical protein
MAKMSKREPTGTGKCKPANTGRAKRAKGARPEQISVFISYVSEDRELAASLEAELLQLFAVAASLPPVKVFRDVGSIGKGLGLPHGDYQRTGRGRHPPCDLD